MLNEQQIQQLIEEATQPLLDKIDGLEKKIETYSAHQHLGVDGSPLFESDTPFKGKSLELVGNAITRQEFQFTPLTIADGRDQSAQQRAVGIGIANLGTRDEDDETVQFLVAAGKVPDLTEGVKPANQTDWVKMNWAQLAMIQNPQGTYSVSGPSFLSPLSFLLGERTPIVAGTGTITQGGSTISDSTARFSPDELLLGLVTIYNSDGNVGESYRVLSHTSNTLTLGTVLSNGATTAASFSLTSGTYSYRVRMPMLLGSAELPWQRIYAGEDIRLGYGSSGGSQPRYIKWGTGSPEGVVTANIGSIYLRFDGSTSTSLYVKTANNGSATGWTAK